MQPLSIENSRNTPLGNRGRGKIHPHKFTMWVAIGSIVMMFAGLTSAYIVKSQLASWNSVAMPKVFWYSTAIILLSSLMMQVSIRAFKEREMNRYRFLIGITTLLGVTFIFLQWIGFTQLWSSGINFKGSGAGQFLYVIAGLHAIHVLGGVVALLVTFLKALFGKTKSYNVVPVEVIGTYWHFVDALWIYLFVFFIWIG